VRDGPGCCTVLGMTGPDVAAVEYLQRHTVSTSLTGVFAGSGHSLYVTGGSVRDAILGTTFSNVDVSTSADIRTILQLIGGLPVTWRTGDGFGSLIASLGALPVGISTLRAEPYVTGGPKPAGMFGATIEQDLARRDLTVNAIAVCLVGDGRHAPGDVIDPVGGLADLHSRVLHTPDDPHLTMADDPLRQLRTVRFAAGRNLRIGRTLSDAIHAHAGRLPAVPVERRTAELLRIMNSGPRTTTSAARIAADLTIAGHLFGGFTRAAASGALDRLPASAAPVTQLTALYCTLTGTGADADTALRDLRLTAAVTAAVTRMGALAGALTNTDMTRRQARQLIRDTGDQLPAALVVGEALNPDAPALNRVRSVLAEEPHVHLPLPISGRDLLDAGLTGPAVGAGLRAATRELLDTGALTRERALQVAVGSARAIPV
jgi:hypothetical protein